MRKLFLSQEIPNATRCCQDHDHQWVTAQRKSQAVSCTASAFFVFILLLEQVPDDSENKKARYEVPGFFFVAEADKISNLKLVDDILNILEFIESKASQV